MVSKDRNPLRVFGIELVVYAVLVAIYFFAVLHFMGSWLKELYDANKTLYALVALLLVAAQGMGLEAVTSWLLRFISKKVG